MEGTRLRAEVSKAQSYWGITDIVSGSGGSEHASQGDRHQDFVRG